MITPRLFIAVIEALRPGTIHGKDFSVVRTGSEWRIGRWNAPQPHPDESEIGDIVQSVASAWEAVEESGALPVFDSDAPGGVRAMTAEEQFSRLTRHEKLGVIFREMPPTMRAKCYAMGMTHAWDRRDYEALKAMVETYAPDSDDEQELRARALACIEEIIL